MAKTKSMAQIVSQANRLHHALYEGNWNGNEFTGVNAKRMEKVLDIMRRYNKNVCKYFGQKDCMSNKQFNTHIDLAIYMGINN